MPYALYYATTQPPEKVTHEDLNRLVPVHFSSEQDAVHAAALVLRGGQFVWRIEGPGLELGPAEIARRCEPTLRMFKKPPGSGGP